MSDPFKITEPTCISFSGGRTGAYMLWRVLQSHGGALPADAIVCFANTGKEDEKTLEFVRDCAVNWGVDIHWVERVFDEVGFKRVTFETASRDGEPYEALIDKKKYLPNPVTRFCSHELKNIPIAKLTLLADDQTMVGVRVDEPHRIPKMRKRGLLIPLVNAGVNKTAVMNFWRNSNFDLRLELINDETPDGNCDLCFLKSFDTVYQSIAKKPSKAIWWAKQEKKIDATFHKDRPSYAAMAKNVANQVDFIGHEDEAIPCFCGD